MDDDNCGCICNHAGACTGCGVCWLEVYGREQQISSLFGIPPARLAPPPIPAGCICAYTWHWSGDGRAVRNSPIMTCPADHSAVDAAAAQETP